MAAAAPANPGSSITLAASRIAAIPHPAPKMPTTIGRPIASTDPNATSRMTTAARTPIASVGGPDDSPDVSAANIEPPSSTWSVPPGWPSRSASIRSASAASPSASRSGSPTVA
jgi:hypothetical protein